MEMNDYSERFESYTTNIAFGIAYMVVCSVKFAIFILSFLGLRSII